MNNHKKEDIKFLKVISNYQLNEIPSLIKNIIIVSFWISLIIGIFFLIDLFIIKALDYSGITNNGNSEAFDNLINKINNASDYFFLGKFGLWGSIIFIGLIMFAKADEDWFEKYSVTFQVPVWSWKTIIFFSLFLLGAGFLLKLLHLLFITYLCFLIPGLLFKLTSDKTFRKVAKRVYPDLEDHEKLTY